MTKQTIVENLLKSDDLNSIFDGNTVAWAIEYLSQYPEDAMFDMDYGYECATYSNIEIRRLETDDEEVTRENNLKKAEIRRKQNEIASAKLVLINAGLYKDFE